MGKRFAMPGVISAKFDEVIMPFSSAEQK